MSNEILEVGATFEFEVLKLVTRPLIKLDSEPRFLLFQGEMFLSEPAKGTRADASKPSMEPPTIAHVKDMQRGVEGQIVVNAVLKANLEEKYPDAAYVGKVFRVAKTNIEGKKYKGFDIAEVRIKEKAAEPKSPATTHKAGK